jgi:hypothetical protein
MVVLLFVVVAGAWAPAQAEMPASASARVVGAVLIVLVVMNRNARSRDGFAPVMIHEAYHHRS